MFSITDTSADTMVIRDIITNAIVNDEYLKRFSTIPNWKGLIPIEWADTVLSASVAFYGRFASAPKKQYILNFLNRNQKEFKFRDDVLPTLIDFLNGLPDEVNINAEYEIENTISFFRKRSLTIAKEQLETALQVDDVNLAEQAIKVKSTEIDHVDNLDVLNMDAVLQEAVQRVEEPLLLMGGAFGQLVSSHLTKGCLVFFLATAKAGKTWCLYTLASKIYNSGKNVLLFAAGDLDKLDNSIRIGHIMSKNDTASCQQYSGIFAYPCIDCKLNQNQTCPRSSNKIKLTELVEDSIKKFDDPEQLLASLPAGYAPCNQVKTCPDAVYTWTYEPRDVQYRGWQGLNTHKEISKRRNGKVKFKIKIYPNNTLNTAEIEKQVQRCVEIEGWTPDVVMIDYADIMGNEVGVFGNKEQRHVENERWKNLRKLTQSKYGYGIVTLSQSNRAGYSVESLDETNTNEDRRKLDHATAVFSLNQTDIEKDFRIARVACLRARGKAPSKKREVVLLQAYESGKFLRDSFFRVRK